MPVTYAHKLHYLAYGSNLHPVRLGERISSAHLIDVIDLSGYCLKFHKLSNDGSAKCNLIKTNTNSDRVYAALYEMDYEQKHILDRFEGKGKGYRDCPVDIHHQGHKVTCFMYLAETSHINDQLQPYHWYKNLVLAGAQHLGFPAAYVAQIKAVESKQDNNIQRLRNMQTLLEKMDRFR